MNRRRAALAALLSASALIVAPQASLGEAIDKGSFKLFRHDRPLGAETFEFSETQDSVIVRARQFLTMITPHGDEPLEKGIELYVSRHDYALRVYQSRRTFQGKTLTRGLVVADTHYVAYRESGRGGDGESRVLPPGRLFVMDSQMMTLFDVICRSLQNTTFESRSLNLLALGPRDTMLDARAVVMGSETIRWGGRPVVARKVKLIADSQTTFTLWVGPQGQLLRLSEPLGGLRAERDPPPVKRRPPTPKPNEPKPGG
jgi:hypothetical protein